MPHAPHTSAAGDTELTFLMACVGRALQPVAAAPTAPAGLDVPRFLRQARHHRCVPLAYAACRAAGGAGLRAADLDALGRMAAADAVRATFLARRTAELSDRMEAAGLRVAPLKGPVLGAIAYGDIALRPCDDIDLLAHPDDFLAVTRLLEQEGFRPLVRLSAAEARAHMRIGWDRAFWSPRGDYCVEIASGVAPRHFAVDVPAGWLWERLARRTLDGGTVNVLAPEQALFLLAVHGAKHLWCRLIWAADIAAWASRHPALDWPSLLDVSATAGARRMLLLGLDLGRRVGGCVPAPSCADVRQDPAVPPLAEQVERWWSTMIWRHAGRRTEIGFHLAARERRRDRACYLLRLGLTPSYADWRWVRLPSPLRFLYYPLRLLRLLLGR